MILESHWIKWSTFQKWAYTFRQNRRSIKYIRLILYLDNDCRPPHRLSFRPTQGSHSESASRTDSSKSLPQKNLVFEGCLKWNVCMSCSIICTLYSDRNECLHLSFQLILLDRIDDTVTIQCNQDASRLNLNNRLNSRVN